MGSEKEWYSFAIPEYDQLKELDPVSQAAGQLHYITQAVSHGLQEVNESRKLVVQYEDFCAAPARYYELLLEKLQLTDTASYSGPDTFSISKSDADEKSINNAIRSFEYS